MPASSSKMKRGKSSCTSSSAIFALVRRATVDKVEPEVAKFGGKLLHTSLSHEAEAKFQAMLDEANKPA